MAVRQKDAGMSNRYEVTVWIESDGEPEDDPRVSKVVEVQYKHAALDIARNKVRDENPELNHRKIWAWTIRRVYVCITMTTRAVAMLRPIYNRVSEVDMKYRIALHKSDEGFSVSVPGLPGCWSQGVTEQEALENVREAIREYLSVVDDQLRGGLRSPPPCRMNLR